MVENCLECRTAFTADDRFLSFLERASPRIGGRTYPLPAPRLCRSCREQRRLGFRNERQLYHRTCDLTGKKMITIFSPDKPYRVYSYDAWWGDGWDATAYGRDYDFDRPFFEQFRELWREAPQLGLLSSRNDNTEYSNFSEQEKDCYLVFASNRNRDCYYSEYIWDSRNCMDCTNVERMECCYMCVDCSNCFECFYSQECHNSRNLRHCFDCQSSVELFACAGLRNRSFSILNEQQSEAQYRSRLENPAEVRRILKQYPRLQLSTPRRFAKILHCENATGSNLRNCRNMEHAFTAFDCEDCGNIENVPGKGRDLREISGATHCELGYEMVSVAFGYRTAFCLYSHTGLRDSYYTVCCASAEHLFGCVAVRNREYCILNKQYNRDDYEQLVPRIIEHMTAEGQWGEFFPLSISPFGYNETTAAVHYPIVEVDAVRRGWPWHYAENSVQSERASSSSAMSSPCVLPEEHRKNVLICPETGKQFRVIPRELEFYRSFGLPVPQLSPNARYLQRFKLQNPNKLWARQCDNVLAAGERCPQRFFSPYSSERPEKVFCEQCYLSSVY